MELTLLDWAQQKWRAAAPGIATLRRWCREGRIIPAPRKIGKTWLVRAEADYQ